MNLDQFFKPLSKEEMLEYGNTLPLGFTYESNNLLTYRDSNGFWYEYTYDSNNINELTFRNSNGSWREYTYDSNNNLLTYKNSNDTNRIVLINGEDYTLWYDINSKNYVAGCHELSYKECLDCYKKSKDEYSDAKLFMKTIRKHHKTVA